MIPVLIADPTNTGRCINFTKTAASLSWAILRKEARLTLPEALSIFARRPAGSAGPLGSGDVAGTVSSVFFFLKRANVLPSIFASSISAQAVSHFQNLSEKRPKKSQPRFEIGM
jgi:hypothetical protein